MSPAEVLHRAATQLRDGAGHPDLTLVHPPTGPLLAELFEWISDDMAAAKAEESIYVRQDGSTHPAVITPAGVRWDWTAALTLAQHLLQECPEELDAGVGDA